MTHWYDFVSGAIMIASLVAAAFFFRFHAKTRESLFSLFGWAFLIFGAERLLIMIEEARLPTGHPLIYLIRLVGFGLILFGVIQKNRQAKQEA